MQDQIAAAYGGVNFIEIPQLPGDASSSRWSLSRPTREALDARLLLVYLGRAHDSSAVHREVIASHRARRRDARRALDGLRALARAGPRGVAGR